MRPIKSVFVFALFLAPTWTFSQNQIFTNIKATRQGMVGTGTSNGHQIVPSDWFVALPEGSALASMNLWNSNVRIYFTNNSITRSVIAPVWDVGPWNNNDDYWNPDPPSHATNDLSNPDYRSVYIDMNKFWTNTYNPIPTPGYTPGPLGTPPPGWNPDPNIFPRPPSITTNYFLGVGNPQAAQVYEVCNQDNSLDDNVPLVNSIDSTTYNYALDEPYGRHPWYKANPLNGAGIDFADGVFKFGLILPGNSLVNWGFTSELPSVLNVTFFNQQGVTLYNRAGGSAIPTINLPISTNQPISIVIRFNQSMLETQMDDDPNFISACGAET
jgi:hypothetical protein